ncbi:MAG: TonB-dependent receptor domain-containing protein [Bacteroidia bacterium]
MKRFSISVLMFLIVSVSASAQMGGWGGGGGGSAMKSRMNSGHFYGKVVDSATGQSIPFAAVQLTGPKWDSVSKTLKTAIIAGQLTTEKGEFSLEKIPVAGPMFTPIQYTLQISSIGYKVYTKTISFDLSKMMQKVKKMQAAQSGDNSNPTAGLEGVIDIVDKDLGNIKLSSTAQQLKAVTISGEPPPMEIKLDKRVFDVTKSIVNAGGTAEDVLKSIPAVNVDIDGNVTLRNASPQIYVDGLPTTLTIDQIPADEIDKIEVITNPSAKYDAAAGSGGIINIIMKHNQALGYNGSVRGGIDEYGKLMGGLDLNVREKKINVFADLFYKQIQHKMYGTETKTEADTAEQSATINTQHQNPYMNLNQHDTNTMIGYFSYVRAGFDYFIDNRNTLTVNGTYATGHFSTTDLLHTTTDTLHGSNPQGASNTFENSTSTRLFNNVGASVLFKHLYPKDEENITASITLNQGSTSGTGTYDISNYNTNGNEISYIPEQQTSNGVSGYYVGKADFTDPVTKKSRIEAGVMATVNNVNSISDISLGNIEIGNESDTVSYNSQVYAAYFTYSHDFGALFSAMAGIRAEQSFYSGQQSTMANDGNDTTYKLSPQTLLYFFPSASATYHLTENTDLQLSYTTHITRPGFSQLVIENYSNSTNVQIGNPNLKPAYMNSFELNLMKSFDRKNTLLISAYYKLTDNIITTQLDSFRNNPLLKQEQYFSTYENAISAYSEGLEFTSQNSVSTWLDLTANINFFESGIDATNLNIPDTAKKFLSYFAKLNLTFKLPKNFSIQLNSNYLSKAEVPPGGSGGGRWGGGAFGGGMGGGITPSASGYIDPNYWMDAAIKKDMLKNNKLSLTFSVKDIFATAVSGTSVLATNPEGIPLYYQTTSRRRDPRFFQFTVSYKFGQTDMSLFKKKNNNIDMGPDMGAGDAQ